MGDKKYTVIGIGELLWDIYPDGKQIGGAPANFTYHCKLLGAAKSYIISRVGNDTLGKEAVKLLKNKKINADYIGFDKGHPTGVVTVYLDANSKPDYTIHQDVAWDYISIDNKTCKLAKTADAICFGTLASRCKMSKKSIFDIIDSTPSQCLKIFDINLRQNFYRKEMIYGLLKRSNILKISDEELPVVANMLSIKYDEKNLLQNILKKFDLKLIALTKGSEGSILAIKDQFYIHQGFNTKIVDTVGAGDSFTASMTMGLLKKLDYKTIIEESNRYAAYICSKKGGMPEYSDYIGGYYG